MFNDEAVNLLLKVKNQLLELEKEAELNSKNTKELLDAIIKEYDITPNDIKKDLNLYHN